MCAGSPVEASPFRPFSRLFFVNGYPCRRPIDLPILYSSFQSLPFVVVISFRYRSVLLFH